jgi:glutamyl-tRNA reductase
LARLCVVGLSHKTAPIELREKLAFPDGELEEALKRAAATPGVEEVMIVSTCNRVEIYASSSGAEAVRRFLVEGRVVSAAVEPHLYAHEGAAALKHLFRVAASLDSMVVGESQILGQVKEAYALAARAGTVGALLQRAMPRAFQLAKRVRSDTEVASGAASIASVAVDLASQIFGDLNGRSVLVVGAGKMGDLSARHLRASGIGDLHVVNRTLERASELAARLEGTAAPWSELDALLTKVDIVLCSTGASEPVIRAAQIHKVMRARRGRWLFLIDIAVPRDVEPEVGNIENVYLYDVDELDRVVTANRAGRAREAEVAERMVEEEVARFLATERTQGAVPTIKALREKFTQVAQAEAERTLGRLASPSEKDRAQVQQMAESIVNKLLHPLLMALKREAGEEGESLSAAVRALFDLEDEAPADEAAPVREGQAKRG